MKLLNLLRYLVLGYNPKPRYENRLEPNWMVEARRPDPVPDDGTDCFVPYIP